MYTFLVHNDTMRVAQRDLLRITSTFLVGIYYMARKVIII